MEITHVASNWPDMVEQINLSDSIYFAGWFGDNVNTYIECFFPEKTVAIWRVKYKSKVINSQRPADLPF